MLPGYDRKVFGVRVPGPPLGLPVGLEDGTSRRPTAGGEGPRALRRNLTRARAPCNNGIMPKQLSSTRRGFLRIAQNIESICGKRLQRAKGGSANEDFYVNCVHLAKRAQAGIENSGGIVGARAMNKLWMFLKPGGHRSIWLKAKAGKH
mgnify:CR=1 FL=1